ncbi:50S ribosomal protein L25/general stress protein Ctc [Cesiribacter sp. SM1]|uniref:50S ribosomal protein L25/general stress protein Ctc n=1 Tax=Cesiribacter sp. SM1 TaxID=2861196 RepID=UPI001CD2E86C|nr:50S ribosomal protein L25/general stress protein Ctc [Cesiribacter sp. SM1]
MKTVEIIGYNRANLGKTESRDLRAQGSVPCVLYGGQDQIHFHTPAYLFKDLVYTPDAAFVKVNIEGKEYNAVLQDVQFHPVNEMILHADFLQLFEGKPVKMDVPVRTEGTSPGVVAGGKLIFKLRKLTIKALPKDMPDFISVDISGLELGKSARVSDVKPENYQILNAPATPIATVEIPRALRGKTE